MFCYNCGDELKEQHKFCPGCGAQVNGSKLIQENHIGNKDIQSVTNNVQIKTIDIEALQEPIKLQEAVIFQDKTRKYNKLYWIAAIAGEIVGFSGGIIGIIGIPIFFMLIVRFVKNLVASFKFGALINKKYYLPQEVNSKQLYEILWNKMRLQGMQITASTSGVRLISKTIQYDINIDNKEGTFKIKPCYSFGRQLINHRLYTRIYSTSVKELGKIVFEIQTILTEEK